jgi:hypothetical protein
MRKKLKKPPLEPNDVELLERLNEHPQMKERFLAILSLAEDKKGAAGTADEVEALLVEEVRRLGAQTMGDWARGRHARLAAEIKAQDPTSYCGKKNA